MARRNFSPLLETRNPCSVPWDSMQGEGHSRFCSECQCPVFDFAQMEPRAVKARLEASRGELCARITRKNGQIQMLAPPPAPRRNPERAPALAAGLMGAWLTVASAAQAASCPQPPALVAAPAEPERDAGLAARAPAARYSEAIEVTSNFAHVVDGVTTGMTAYSLDLSLRELFEVSQLAITARVGDSEVLAVDDGIAEVRTTLRIARRFKGEGWDRQVIYRHSVPVEAFGPGQEPLPELIPGAMVLAFLNRAEGETDISGWELYEAASFSGALRGLWADELVAYSARLDELALLHLMAGPEGELDPHGLMEWLVAAAADPATRKENTSREIRGALAAFAALAEHPADADTDAPALGAAFTADQQERLTAALFATKTMEYRDLELYRLVRQLDPVAAARWVAETLSRGIAPQGGGLWELEEFAAPLGEAESKAFLAEAGKRTDAVAREYRGVWSPEAEEERQRRFAELGRVLLAELASRLRGDG